MAQRGSFRFGGMAMLRIPDHARVVNVLPGSNIDIGAQPNHRPSGNGWAKPNSNNGRPTVPAQVALLSLPLVLPQEGREVGKKTTNSKNQLSVKTKHRRRVAATAREIIAADTSEIEELRERISRASLAKLRVLRADVIKQTAVMRSAENEVAKRQAAAKKQKPSANIQKTNLDFERAEKNKSTLEMLTDGEEFLGKRFSKNEFSDDYFLKTLPGRVAHQLGLIQFELIKLMATSVKPMIDSLHWPMFRGIVNAKSYSEQREFVQKGLNYLEEQTKPKVGGIAQPHTGKPEARLAPNGPRRNPVNQQRIGNELTRRTDAMLDSQEARAIEHLSMTYGFQMFAVAFGILPPVSVSETENEGAFEQHATPRLKARWGGAKIFEPVKKSREVRNQLEDQVGRRLVRRASAKAQMAL